MATSSALIVKSRRLGEAVPRGGLGEIARQHPAGDIEMRDAVLRDRVAPRGGDLEDLAAAGFVLGDAVAVEQHDGVFDLRQR